MKEREREGAHQVAVSVVFCAVYLPTCGFCLFIRKENVLKKKLLFAVVCSSHKNGPNSY